MSEKKTDVETAFEEAREAGDDKKLTLLYLRKMNDTNQEILKELKKIKLEIKPTWKKYIWDILLVVISVLLGVIFGIFFL